MSAFSDGLRTVGCRLDTFVPDAHTVSSIRLAVERVHEATIQATVLLNLHIRKCVSDGTPLTPNLFTGNWILKAFQEVTHVGSSTRPVARDSGLADTFERLMPSISKVNRSGLTQLFHSNANTIATVAKNNVWMHFSRRVFQYVQSRNAITKDEYAALSKQEKTQRRLRLLRIAADIRRSPDQPYQSAPEDHAYVVEERDAIGLDRAVGEWDGKPLLYHLKTSSHKFLNSMSIMSQHLEASGGKAFSLYPLRRSMVPCHIRFDAVALNQTLQALRNERLGRGKKTKEEEDFTFANTVNYRAAGISQCWRIEDGFTTDGVTVRVQQFQGSRDSVEKQRTQKACDGELKNENKKRKRRGEETVKKEKKTSSAARLASMPLRGIWAIDELKRVSRLQDVHVIGVDPGKRELVVATDSDSATSSAVRYTLPQRQKDTRTRQYLDERDRDMPVEVRFTIEDLANYNSRTADLWRFRAYAADRQLGLSHCLSFYSRMDHRHRRWKSYIKTQKSEERLYRDLNALRNDSRPIVLAYGSWGLVAGKMCNKGNPPCIGVGLMRKLARRFVVAPTPEQYTSKTCHKCLGVCGPHPTMRSKRKKREIRGLRVCQDESCKSHLNRDINASRNIGLQFKRLFMGEPPIRKMTTEDLEFNQHRICLDCEN